MSALPAPTGDVLEIDYQLRGRSRAISGNPSRSRPGTAALQASETTTPRSPPRRQLQSAPSSQEQWQRQRQLRQPASPPVSPDKLAAWQGRLREQPTGGAPYPRGVMLSDIDAKAEARKAHRNAVLDRQVSSAAPKFASTASYWQSPLLLTCLPRYSSSRAILQYIAK